MNRPPLPTETTPLLSPHMDRNAASLASSSPIATADAYDRVVGQPHGRVRAWMHDRVWAVATWMTIAAGIYWVATLVPTYAVFTLTDAIADRPGDGPYTTKALMSIARGVAMPLGFASTLSGSVRRAVVGGWRRPMGLVVYSLLFTWVPNVLFAVDSAFVRVASRFVGSLFFSWAFCAYIDYAQGRRASDVIMPIATACMLLAAPLSRALSPLIGRHLLGLSLSQRAQGDADRSASLDFTVYTGTLSQGKANDDDTYRWLPLTVSLVLLVPTLLGAVALGASPPPSVADQKARMRRTPVSAAADRAWLRKHWAPLAGMSACNAVLQSVRVVRDVFAADLLGGDAPWWHWIIADVPACLGACLFYAPFGLIAGHRRAFMAVTAIGLVAAGLMGAAGLLGLAGAVAPLPFLIVSGLGYFVAVVPFAGGGVVFERLIAASRMPIDSMLVNVVCQLPAYAASLAIVVATPLARDMGAYFNWTALAGGAVLVAAYTWTLLSGWRVLAPDSLVLCDTDDGSAEPMHALTTLHGPPSSTERQDPVGDDHETLVGHDTRAP
ncbi:hypothetical protein pneo_cds_966 [Pandoravirus neocaledonia]|uniref:Uncharacterized protein n=1 Tax=Pandoravirus neocaledonia TaxID=2107708 RepID=A0A2U7UDR5_9VIRU|nr:hypothetical protein pneo_cds_966 [Pandoravirus neocaledonia]AVK76573.1 hypothetical protein pneo_cds_966 [Pandoravirus neocaledonia]